MIEKNNKKVTKKITNQIIISSSIIITVVIVLVITIFSALVRTDIKNQAYRSVSSLNSELGIAVDTQLMNLRNSAITICSDDRVGAIVEQTHSATDGLTDDEIQIKNVLSKAAVMNDFSNFMIVCSDGFYLGVMNETLRQFVVSNDIYASLSSLLDNAESTWTTEVTPEKNMISHVIRINEQAVFIASIDSADIVGVMDAAAYLDGVKGYICDKKYSIFCTTDMEAKPEGYIDTSISRMIYTVGGTRSGKAYTVGSYVLCNGWIAVTAIPNSSLLAIVTDSLKIMVPIAIVIWLIAIILTIVLTNRIIDGVDRAVDKLSDKSQNDLLTGLLNKKTFEEYVKNRLETPVSNCSYALVFMDVDNFKGVNDRCGHEMGDEVLRSFAHSIGATFRELDIKGRLGGDEFAVLMEINSTDRVQVIRIVNEACKRFRDRLHQKAHSARQSIPAVTSSMGAAIWKGDGEGFEAIYRKADNALYSSKEKGKDTWTIYGLTEADLKSAMDKTEDK